MLNETRFIFRALQSIASRRGYSFATYSYGWIIDIRDRDRIFRLTGYIFDINPSSSILMARDKFATDCLTRSILPEGRGIPSAFIPCSWKEWFIGKSKYEILADFFRFHEFPFVMKDAQGSQGKDVFLIESGEDLAQKTQYFESIWADAVISPYIRSEKELRIILLDGKVHLAYYKFAKDSWKFNLSQGAETEVIAELEYESIFPQIECAKAVMKSLGLRFASCDFLIDSDDWKFLEVNGGVCVDRFVKQHPQYSESLEKMYEEAMEKSFI